VPTLYVCPVEDVLGRVPLLPCYLKGNTVNTIPDSCRSQIPRGADADSRQDSWTGSRFFEVNIWMWQYGKPFPRKVSKEEAVAMQKKEGTGIQGKSLSQEELQLFSACARQPPQKWAMNVIDNGT
jgi:hypothetical protein